MRHTAATSPLLEELTARQARRSADLQARHAAVIAARQTPPAATHSFDPTAEPVRRDEVVSLFASALHAQVQARIATQPRVRIVRGGHSGETGRISGVGMAGGHVITTDSETTLYLAERDIVRLGKE